MILYYLLQDYIKNIVFPIVKSAITTTTKIQKVLRVGVRPSLETDSKYIVIGAVS